LVICEAVPQAWTSKLLSGLRIDHRPDVPTKVISTPRVHGAAHAAR
jgi:hypothetical protein